MKIIEKKCPNCGANLEFDVGEKNVKCSSCRRLFAIEYDKDKFSNSEDNLQAKDVRLKVIHKIFSIFFFTWLFIILGTTLLFVALFLGISTWMQNVDVPSENPSNIEKMLDNDSSKKIDEDSESFREMYNDAVANGKNSVNRDEFDKMYSNLKEMMKNNGQDDSARSKQLDEMYNEAMKRLEEGV